METMVEVAFITAAMFGAKQSHFRSCGIFHLNATGKLLLS